MLYTSLIQKVRYRINEIVPEAESKITLNALSRPMDALIKESLQDAVSTIYSDLPAHRINGTSAKWAKVEGGVKGLIYIDDSVMDLTGVTVVSFDCNKAEGKITIVGDGLENQIELYSSSVYPIYYANILLSNGAFFPSIYDLKETALHTPFTISTISSGYVEERSDNVVTLTLPSEQIKIKRLALSSWTKTVTIGTLPGTPEYNLQASKYTRGKTQKPVVAIEDNRILKLYSALDDDDAITEAKYIAVDSPEYVQDNLIPILTYAAAALFISLTMDGEGANAWDIYKKKLAELT